MTTKKKNDKKCIPEDSSKKSLFWNCSEQKLWPGRKNAIFSHKEDSQNIVIFSASDVQKTSKIRPPPRWVRCHVSAERKHVFGQIPKKSSFFWDFSKCKLRESEFPRLFVISPNYRFHHPHPSSPFGFIICIRVIMVFAEAVEGKRGNSNLSFKSLTYPCQKMIAAVPDHFCRHFNSVRAFRHR